MPVTKATDSSKTPNREELLQLAIQAAKNNQKEGARVMFRQVLEQDKRNERAMMWMAQLAESPAEREQWLRNALQVNPNNRVARETLQRAHYRKAASSNRTLIIFGVIAAVLVVVLIVVVFLILTSVR
jgi:Tfp pilus assembly protein PilF